MAATPLAERPADLATKLPFYPCLSSNPHDNRSKFWVIKNINKIIVKIRLTNMWQYIGL
jgi:hypothetical protein